MPVNRYKDYTRDQLLKKIHALEKKRDDVLIGTIDNNEKATLLMLHRELFPGYDIKTVIIEHNPKGLPSKNFSDSHEYAHFLIPKGLSVIGKNPEAKEDTRNLRRAG